MWVDKPRTVIRILRESCFLYERCRGRYRMVADYVTSDTQTPSVLDRVTSEPHGILNIRNRLAVYCRRNSHRLHGSV